MKSSKDVDLQALLRLEDEMTESSLREFMEFVRRHHRLKTLSYLCPQRSFWLVEDPCLALAYSDAWIEHCVAEGRAVEKPAESGLDWIFLPKLEDAMRRMRIEAGARSGAQDLIVPLRGSGNALVGLFCASADDDDAGWAGRRPGLCRALVDVAYYVHRRAERMHASDFAATTEPMTCREIEALGWLADGAPVRDIGALMSIAPSAVRAHLDSGRYKLGAFSFAHAAAKALRAGLI
jgi:LuxR family quorum-sensing system transcriptional regulator SinR